ncbi:hypothetical protein, partial [Escherichia coli]|uniref:hypothetical protein n=1 Tax=Escherichia coli TaxID=562 RepID=UPI001BB4844B
MKRWSVTVFWSGLTCMSGVREQVMVFVERWRVMACLVILLWCVTVRAGTVQLTANVYASMLQMWCWWTGNKK